MLAWALAALVGVAGAAAQDRLDGTYLGGRRAHPDRARWGRL
jgi:hypothetical protein